MNGIQLAPAQYTTGWFTERNGTVANWPDHFILWLPAHNGATNWFNDPLAYNNGQQDCQYDLSSVAVAFGGAYLLPTTSHGETPPTRIQVEQACALKAQPNHTSLGIAALAAGDQGLDLGNRSVTNGETWARIQWRDKTGFVLANNLKAV